MKKNTKLNTKKKKRSVGAVPWEDYLIKSLQDPKDAMAYLNAALLDEDPRVFLVALRDVILAHAGSIAAMAEKSKLNRENLYRMLSTKGNPELKSVIALLNSLDMHLAIQGHDKCRH